MCRLPIHRVWAPPAVFLEPVLEFLELGLLCCAEMVEHTGLRVCRCCSCQRTLATINVVMGLLGLLRRAGQSSDELSSHGCSSAELDVISDPDLRYLEETE